MTQTQPNGTQGLRYHIARPPKELYAVMSALAKGTKSAEYRKHGGFLNKNAVCSIIGGAGEVSPVDADEIRRFLKHYSVLGENETGAIPFDAAKADELFVSCNGDQSLLRGKSFVEMCERVSDPGPAPTLVLVPSPVVPSPIVTLEPPRIVYDFINDEDDLLELRREDLAKKLEEMRLELEAVVKEQTRRAEKRRLEHEIEELRLQLEAKQRDLAAHNNY